VILLAIVQDRAHRGDEQVVAAVLYTGSASVSDRLSEGARPNLP